MVGRSRTTYRVKRDGTARPKSSLAKERTCLNVYILPTLRNAWIGLMIRKLRLLALPTIGPEALCL